MYCTLHRINILISLALHSMPLCSESCRDVRFKDAYEVYRVEQQVVSRLLRSVSLPSSIPFSHVCVFFLKTKCNMKTNKAATKNPALQQTQFKAVFHHILFSHFFLFFLLLLTNQANQILAHVPQRNEYRYQLRLLCHAVYFKIDFSSSQLPYLCIGVLQNHIQGRDRRRERKED